MKINKLLATLCVLTALVFSYSFGAFTAKAESVNIGNFSDDFESYQVGTYIEQESTFKNNWTNNVLKGGESQGMDAHLTNIAKVEYESGNAGNKVLHINNTVGNDSFFQIGPNGDYRTKNFTATFRVKFLTDGVPERTWIGISFRKKAEVHYTGTNNLMFTIQRYKSSASISAQPYAVFNGGDVNDLLSDSIKNMFGDMVYGSKSDYTIPNCVANEDSPWITYRLEANGTNYKVYVNDVLMLDCTFGAPTYDYFGYLSLNCCQANVLVDDFAVTNNDTELAPPINPLQAPTLSFNQEKNRIEWDMVDGATLYSVYVNGELKTTKTRRCYEMEADLPAGEYSVQVVAVSDDAFVAKDSEMSDAYIYVVRGSTEAGGGCNSALNSASSLAMFGVVVLLLGVVCIVKAKKDE